MDRGYIKLWRKSIESEVFSNKNLWHLWSWCLMKTNKKPKFVSLKTGKGEVSVKVQPGQFIFGRNRAAEELSESPSTVWKRMKKLEAIKCLTIESNNQYSIISICNWEDYQSSSIKKEQPSDSQGTGKELPSDTNKKDKKDKKDKNNSVPVPATKIAERIKGVVLSKRKKNISASTMTAWAREIERMNKLDKVPFDEMSETMNWYEENWSGEYVPVVESARAFREKYDKIQNAIARGSKKSDPFKPDWMNGAI